MKKIKHNMESIAMIIFFSGIVILLFWKCNYGYATLDEAFYPTIAYRFMQGDAILYEEWSNTQLTGFLLLPVLMLYQVINGGMDGIYLYIRYVYTIFKILIAVFLFLRLKKFGKREAYTTSIVFLVFAAHGIMALSYNTFAIGGALVALLLLLDNKESKISMFCAGLAGVAFAVSVMGIPYMMILYGVYLAIVIISPFWKRKICFNEYTAHLFSWKTFWCMTFGGGIACAGLMTYIFSRVSLKNVIDTIPHILYGDPAHSQKSVYHKTLAYFVRILIGNHHNYWIFCGYILLMAILLAYLLDKKRRQNIKNYKLGAVLGSWILLVLYVVTDNYINSIIFIPNVLAFMFIIFSFRQDERVRSLFYCIWIPGMLVSYCEYLASNTGFSGLSAASCVATTASIIIICFEMENTNIKIGGYEKVVASFLIAIFILLVYYRITYVFWEDGGIQSLKATIEQGTAKGLYVTENTKKLYDQMYEDTETIRKTSEDTIVLYQADNTLWMSGRQRCGSYSPLNYSLSADPTILYNYYEEHPDKIADVMYISDGYQNLADAFAVMYDYSVEKKKIGTLLWRVK